MRDVLADLGEDPSREGLQRTPHRVAKALRELTSGYRADVDAMINDALFTESYDEMVLVRDIAFYSLCEHHLLPFFGRAHVAYIPERKILGLSKIPKLVEIYARRLQVQERLTRQIADTLMTKLAPRGVAVVLEARHLCMEMRGAESQLSPTTTSCMLGVFQRDARTRKEFLELAKSRPV
ncbi:MAG: GTP cyclohydrolase I FolE [Elusimicrobia bacterium]|nr:GTP cyclohydrolase I FolE [Elusimicrobiota bacterium]